MPEEKPPRTKDEKASMVDGVSEAARAYALATERKVQASEALKARLAEEANALEMLKAARLSLLKETEETP